jgi:hypothetical protein
VTVGCEHHLLIRERLDDLHRVRRRADDVGQRLHVGGAVDVADHGVIRILLEPLREQRRGTAVGERAARVEIRDHDDLVGVEDLRGLRHEVHAAEADHVGLRPRRRLRQLERVTDEVREVLDLGLLVVVREDHGVALGLEPPDLGLELLRVEVDLLPCGGMLRTHHR